MKKFQPAIVPVQDALPDTPQRKRMLKKFWVTVAKQKEVFRSVGLPGRLLEHDCIPMDTDTLLRNIMMNANAAEERKRLLGFDSEFGELSQLQEKWDRQLRQKMLANDVRGSITPRQRIRKQINFLPPKQGDTTLSFAPTFRQEVSR